MHAADMIVLVSFASERLALVSLAVYIRTIPTTCVRSILAMDLGAVAGKLVFRCETLERFTARSRALVWSLVLLRVLAMPRF